LLVCTLSKGGSRRGGGGGEGGGDRSWIRYSESGRKCADHFDAKRAAAKPWQQEQYEPGLIMIISSSCF
jgi:hypothetical protein